jgi:Carbonic anhydrases/acetyltransferases, isoleucine patch superfamily
MIQRVNGNRPDVPRDAYVHPNAMVIGRVRLGKQSSVWPGAVIRGDISLIAVGERTNIQDGCVLHTDTLQLRIGNGVSVGHRAVLHSCDVEDGALIGMGAIVLDAAKVGKDSIVGAGAVVPPGFVVPPGSVVMGVPCHVVREVKPEEIEENRQRCEQYIALSQAYLRTGDIL